MIRAQIGERRARDGIAARHDEEEEDPGRINVRGLCRRSAAQELGREIDRCAFEPIVRPPIVAAAAEIHQRDTAYRVADDVLCLDVAV